MKTNFKAVAVIILLAAAFNVQAQSEKDEASIRGIMDEQAAAWNRGDLEGFMSLGYWRSDKLKFVSGDKITYGWQQTLDNYKRSYSNAAAMGKLTFSDLDITLLGKDSAFVVGSWSLAREKDNPKGKFTLLWRKFKEGWRIVTDHSS